MFKAQWDTPLILTIFIWLCLLPLVALLVVPFFGWGVGLTVAGVLLVVMLVLCWLLCVGTMASFVIDDQSTGKD